MKTPSGVVITQNIPDGRQRGLRRPSLRPRKRLTGSIDTGPSRIVPAGLGLVAGARWLGAASGAPEMTEVSQKLSATARNVLTLAATRDDQMVRVPQLPVAAARQVIRSMLNAGLVEEIPALVDDADFAWRTPEDGDALMLRATEVGLARIGEPAK